MKNKTLKSLVLGGLIAISSSIYYRNNHYNEANKITENVPIRFYETEREILNHKYRIPREVLNEYLEDGNSLENLNNLVDGYRNKYLEDGNSLENFEHLVDEYDSFLSDPEISNALKKRKEYLDDKNKIDFPLFGIGALIAFCAANRLWVKHWKSE